MFKLKKGTEKPIEIFLALFIILAVSMVMLKMFRGQITDKTTEMQDISRESNLEQAIKDAKLECAELCSEASQNGCSGRSIAKYCTQQVGSTDLLEGFNALDLSGDFRVGFHMDAGTGICEDQIYCPLISECNCGQKLDLDYCLEKSCQHWSKNGLNTSYVLNKTYPLQDSEVCRSDPNYDAKVMWTRGLPDNCSAYI
ncbi:MAG: hypothetical protein ACQESG_01050 [Nanobdellota archaeon]